MPLSSRCFSGDPKLEAAAIQDSAHIGAGSSGPHVGKIQLALNTLNQAALTIDNIYGQATADAVLAYKKKRGLVNRSYQTSADNITGKMTVTSLDAEMRDFETENDKRPRIVAIHPAGTPTLTGKPLPDFKPLSLGSRSSPKGDGFGGASSKAKIERSPQIIFPGQPFRAMELKPNTFGTFQVVDGVGGRARCWDDTVGVVIDPAQPNAHQNNMPVTANPHSFQVLAKNVGRSIIEVSKPGASLFKSEMIGLLVVTDSILTTWRPSWAPVVKDTASCTPFVSQAFGGSGVDGMAIFGQRFEVSAAVDPDASIKRDEFEIGILQTLLESSMTAFYVNADVTANWQLVITETKLPIRDSENDSPMWVSSKAVIPLAATGATKLDFGDRPRNVMPWQTKDKKGTLVRTIGEDKFSTWLAARHKATDKLTMINWATWTVNWSAEFDFKAGTGKVLGNGVLTGFEDGGGAHSPVTGGVIANKSVVLKWTGPAGGF